MACCVAATCSKAGEPVHVVAIDLGNHLTEDTRVSAASETFDASNTVYASIATEGTGPGTLAARWIAADGHVLAEQTQQINPSTPAYFEFHFAPPGGWPKGRHKAVFTLNGAGTRTREFEVR